MTHGCHALRNRWKVVPGKPVSRKRLSRLEKQLSSFARLDSPFDSAQGRLLGGCPYISSRQAKRLPTRACRSWRHQEARTRSKAVGQECPTHTICGTLDDSCPHLQTLKLDVSRLRIRTSFYFRLRAF